MTAATPGEVRIPAPVRLFNRALARTRWPAIRAGDILARAARRSGHHEFAWPGSAQAGLDALCADAETAADLSSLGRITLRKVLVDNAANRLHVEAGLAQRPDLLDAPIRRPVFILGLPRTGTTILFNLLAQDPDHRSPRTWEVDAPWPPPAEADYVGCERIVASQRAVDRFHQMAPAFHAIHPQGATLAEEDQRILGMHFSGCGYQHFLKAPAHQAWQFAQDRRAALAWHKRYLQYLQWRVQRPRWLLKSPDDQLYLEAIFSTYPDALVVQTHRDPAEAIPSVASLTWTVRRVFSDCTDAVEVGRDQLEYWGRIADDCMAQRQTLAREVQFVDIDFAQLVKAPMAAVSRIYEALGQPLAEPTAARMRQFLDDNQRGSHGVHRYTPEQFGLTIEAIRERFAGYIDRYLP